MLFSVFLASRGRANLKFRTKDGHLAGPANLSELASQVEMVAGGRSKLNLRADDPTQDKLVAGVGIGLCRTETILHTASKNKPAKG